MSLSANNPKKPLTAASKPAIEMNPLPKPAQNSKPEYKPPLFPSLEQPIELTVNPEPVSETVQLNRDDPEAELQRINTQISRNFTWYLIYLGLLLILYIVVIALYWTDFVGAPDLFFEETSYFVLLLFMAPLWVVGIVIYFSRVHRLQTIFLVTVLLCMLIGVALIIADIFIKHPSSKLDTATNPKIMVCILIVGPGYLFTKASKFRNELYKRKKIIERIQKLKELSTMAKDTSAVNTSLSMKHREMLVL